METVTQSIPKFGVTEKGWETNKELYVLGFVTDNRGLEDRSQKFIGAYNETLPAISPALEGTALAQRVHVSASNVFRRVRADQPVSLSGSGIILYPNLDPKGHLAAHLLVVEHDEGVRSLGRMLESLVNDSDLNAAAAALGNAVKIAPFSGLMNKIGTIVPNLLKNNRDDPLFQHLHSGFDFDNYGLSAEEFGVEDFPIGNDRAFGTLRVRVRPSPDTQPA